MVQRVADDEHPGGFRLAGDAHESDRRVGHHGGRTFAGQRLAEQRGEVVGVEHAEDAAAGGQRAASGQTPPGRRVDQQHPALGIHHADWHIEPTEHREQRIALAAQLHVRGRHLLREANLGSVVLLGQGVDGPRHCGVVDEPV